MALGGAATSEPDILPKKALEDILTLQMAKGKERAFVLCFVDVDGYAALVEKQGEAAGKTVMTRLRAELLRYKSPGQVTFPYGPDEVGALIPGVSVEQVFVILDELRKTVAATSPPFTVRAGLAGFPRDAQDPIELIRKTEDALYRAAREGGNRVCLAGAGNMVLKSNYYTEGQLARLAALARKTDRTEASLLREALDDVLKKYDR